MRRLESEVPSRNLDTEEKRQLYLVGLYPCMLEVREELFHVFVLYLPVGQS